MSCVALVLTCAAAAAPAAGEASVSAINLDAARKQFQAAQEICARDGGKFWGVSLCGPILLVDPQTRTVVANRRDGEGVLKAKGGVFTGSLPNSVNISNTPTQWAGKLWTQLLHP
jgi:hypothetical protein